MVGYLKYVLENCKFALSELCNVNRELNLGMNLNSSADVNRLGGLDRMIKDYLIIRVAGMFDKDSRTVSLKNTFPGNSEIESIEKEEIIKKILENRNRFVAHSDRDYISDGDFIISTGDICSSNLKELLGRLERLLSSQ